MDVNIVSHFYFQFSTLLITGGNGKRKEEKGRRGKKEKRRGRIEETVSNICHSFLAIGWIKF